MGNNSRNCSEKCLKQVVNHTKKHNFKKKGEKFQNCVTQFHQLISLSNILSKTKNNENRTMCQGNKFY